MKCGEALNRSNPTGLERHNMWLRPRPSPTPAASSSPPPHSPFNFRNPPAEPVDTWGQIGSSFKSYTSMATPVFGSKHLAGAAYFSARPPAAPLLLLPISVPGCSIACFSHSPIAHQNVSSAQSVSVVVPVLQDLVTTLPLSQSAKVTSATQVTHRPHVTSSIRRLRAHKNAMSPPTYTHSRLSSVSSLYGGGILKCNVATQAPLVHNARAVAKCASSSSKSDEWLGGVRALRDSHLRLVLRQLRHIDRLNRAVDRVLHQPPQHEFDSHTST